jgi:hypothetical protein
LALFVSRSDPSVGHERPLIVPLSLLTRTALATIASIKRYLKSVRLLYVNNGPASAGIFHVNIYSPLTLPFFVD